MSLEMPDDDEHPNRMPFSGVLTRLDEPSDLAPHGSGGKKTVIPKKVAEEALSTLLGMGIDVTEDFDGHDAKKKIGVITEATIEGNAVHIAGFLYASDFPKECARIKKEKKKLGFSYECQAAISDAKADPWVISRCVFTGAAVLYKDKAAYQTTSLAATAEEDAMTPEELKKLMDSVAGLTTSVAAFGDRFTALEQKVEAAGIVHAKVKPLADGLRACAAAMEAAGVGMHADAGHVKLLKNMADTMEAEAMMNRTPHSYSSYFHASAAGSAGTAAVNDETKKEFEKLQASVAALTTKLTDLQAKGFTHADAPDRKTLPADVIAILNKHSLAAEAEKGALTVAQVDQALKGLTPHERMTQKLKLQAAGVLKAA
jgi:hypothetical protein